MLSIFYLEAPTASTCALKCTHSSMCQLALYEPHSHVCQMFEVSVRLSVDLCNNI